MLKNKSKKEQKDKLIKNCLKKVENYSFLSSKQSQSFNKATSQNIGRMNWKKVILRCALYLLFFWGRTCKIQS